MNTNTQPMSAAEFWWNHLTPEQQSYIKSWYKKWNFVFNVENAYGAKDSPANWSKFPGWPETPQSTFSGV